MNTSHQQGSLATRRHNAAPAIGGFLAAAPVSAQSLSFIAAQGFALIPAGLLNPDYAPENVAKVVGRTLSIFRDIVTMRTTTEAIFSMLLKAFFAATLAMFFVVAPGKQVFAASTAMRVLYPSFSSSWATSWIAKEAGYFSAEGLDVELVRVGGSTRMVAAMLGGSAPIIQAGASAAVAATAAGSDVVIIASIGNVSSFHLMARPEIKQPSDLKGKRAGITTFGSTSDQVVRIALKHFNLEPVKDVAILSLGAQPEAFAALQSGAVQVAALGYPLYPKALKMGMRELINFSELGVEDITGALITTRTFVTKQRDIATRFVKAYVRGAHRYRSDKEFSKGVLGKYGKITDDELLEGTWQDYAPTIQRIPRPSPKALQFLIDFQFKGKTPLPKPEAFVDTSIVDQLEKSGFIDSLYKESK
jgi:NitT/TauT family transport system substrate-binding protein